MSFSKQWLIKLEFSPHITASYETPAQGGDMKSFKPGYDERETFGTMEDDMDNINRGMMRKKMLKRMQQRRGEGGCFTVEEVRNRGKKYLDEKLQQCKEKGNCVIGGRPITMDELRQLAKKYRGEEK